MLYAGVNLVLVKVTSRHLNGRVLVRDIRESISINTIKPGFIFKEHGEGGGG